MPAIKISRAGVSGWTLSKTFHNCAELRFAMKIAVMAGDLEDSYPLGGKVAPERKTLSTYLLRVLCIILLWSL
jgi:hypothetical protein